MAPFFLPVGIPVRPTRNRVTSKPHKTAADVTFDAEVAIVRPSSNEHASTNEEVAILKQIPGKDTLDGAQGEEKILLVERLKRTNEVASTSNPSCDDRYDTRMVVSTVYVEDIKRVAPALGELFGLATPDIAEKPLSERSTEELISQIDAGRFAAEIALLWRVPANELNIWIAADGERFSRAKAARKHQAELWDWAALQVLLYAPSDRVELTRAEKIACHCRWRAKAFCRDDYGSIPRATQVDKSSARDLTTRELEIIARGGSPLG